MAEKISIKGLVVTGAGEGSYYMSLRHYRNEFKKKLGFEPYIGTLNLELRGSELEKLNILRSAKGVTVEKFTSEFASQTPRILTRSAHEYENERGMSFGAVKCFPAEIEKIQCALLLPERSKYRNVIEIICKEHLRKKLELKNGDQLEIIIILD